MTAVEWLIEQIIKYELVPEGTNPDNVLFNKAKEMEHKQLEKAIEYGYELRNNNKPINSGIDWIKEFKNQQDHVK
jgi:hypothetical protein